MGEKPQPALITHFPPEPLCLRVRAGLARTTYSLTVFSALPPHPTCLLALSSSFWAPTLGCPCLFSSLMVRPVFQRQPKGCWWHPASEPVRPLPQFPPSRRLAPCSDSHSYFTPSMFHLLSPPGCLLAFAGAVPFCWECPSFSLTSDLRGPGLRSLAACSSGMRGGMDSSLEPRNSFILALGDLF